MKAIILSAGQGARLLPLTESRPKCLIRLNGRSVLEWQLRGLASAGVEEAVVVTGFAAEQVESALHALVIPGLKVRTLHNPFFAVADNIGSCWAARGEMTGDFMILNGDTLFEPEVAQRLLAAETAPITITISRKPGYDADDMKVSDAEGVLQAVGKTLEPGVVTGESIGFLRFSAEGGRRFCETIDAVMRREGGLKRWYLSVIDEIARTFGDVKVLSIEGLDWGELDYPKDVPPSEALTARWLDRENSSDKVFAA